MEEPVVRKKHTCPYTLTETHDGTGWKIVETVGVDVSGMLHALTPALHPDTHARTVDLLDTSPDFSGVRMAGTEHWYFLVPASDPRDPITVRDDAFTASLEVAWPWFDDSRRGFGGESDEFRLSVLASS